MRTKATVVAISGRRATVEAERTSACEGCHKSEGENACSVCSLMGGDRKMRAEAENSVGAEVGDTVIIESATGRMLWYAALVFLLPMLSAVLFYGLAALLGAANGWRIGAGFFGLCGTFGGLFAYSEYIRKKRCDIVIVEVIRKGP